MSSGRSAHRVDAVISVPQGCKRCLFVFIVVTNTPRQSVQRPGDSLPEWHASRSHSQLLGKHSARTEGQRKTQWQSRHVAALISLAPSSQQSGASGKRMCNPGPCSTASESTTLPWEAHCELQAADNAQRRDAIMHFHYIRGGVVGVCMPLKPWRLGGNAHVLLQPS